MERAFAVLVAGAILAGCSGPPSPSCSSANCPCTSSSDCPAGQTCVLGFCTSALPCRTNADCSTPGDVCSEGACVPGGGSGDGGNLNVDGGVPDSGPEPSLDAGHRDGGARDGGLLDGGAFDGGANNAGAIDAGSDAGGTGAGDGGPGAGDAGGAIDAGCTSRSACPSSLACVSGSCVPCTSDNECSPDLCGANGKCVTPQCSQDTMCAPPALVCTSGRCVSGCLPGSCAAGQRCDDLVTGRCAAASGSTALGGQCNGFSDCAPWTKDGSGECVSLLLASGASSPAFCSAPCQATSGCPPNMVCASFGGGGACIPDSYAGAPLGTGGAGTPCTSDTSCASITGCGHYTPGSGEVCGDTCLQNGACPSGWSCVSMLYFAGVMDGGVACTTNPQCTIRSADALCFSTQEGGDGLCHFVLRADACDETLGAPAATTGASCTSDTNCAHDLCVNGKCADPCCSSADCPTGYGCQPQPEQSASILMACLPAGSGAIGVACDPTAPTNSCRSGVCLPENPYLQPGQPGSNQGYCSDYCCDDESCGPGYACWLLDRGNSGNGSAIDYDLCQKL